MPQLDKVTFLAQFFWLCLFYLGFYYITFKHFLPKISRILTLRKKKMNVSQSGSQSLEQENQQVRQNLDNIISRGLSLSRNVFHDYFSRTTKWLENSLTSVNKTQFKTMNNSYIQSLGEASLSQNILFYHASSPTPESLKVSLFVNKMKNLRKIPENKVQNQETMKKTSSVLENSKKSKKTKK